MMKIKKRLTLSIKKLIGYLNVDIINYSYLSSHLIYGIDLLLIAISFAITCIVMGQRSSLEILLSYRLLLCLLVSGYFIYLFGIHKQILRYSTFRDILSIFYVMLCSFIVLLIIGYLIHIYFGRDDLSPIVLFLFFVIASEILSCSRMFIRLIFNLLQHFQKKKSKNKKAILIYGIKASNISIASSINTNEYSPYYVAGFVSNTQKSNNQTVINLPVYVFTYFYKNTQQFRNIKAILIDKEDMELTEYYMLSECCICNDISILLMPTPVEWQEISKENGNCINAEALLMRSSIHIKNEKIAQEMDGKRLLITGAAGSIGSEIARQVCMFNLTHLILLDIAESPLHDLSIELKEKYPDKNILIVISDTRNFKKMEHVFLLYSPQYIFHAAAYKHVPLMEMQPEEAIMTNVLGTKNVADLAVAYKAERFVMVSTDKAVNPSNVMGASKRIAEIYTQILSAQLNSQASGKNAVTSFIITRFGNVLGSNGSVIPLFLKQIRTGGPVTVTHPDIIRYFMTIPEACNLVLEAGNFGKNGEIYVFDMGKSVKIKNLAEEVIRLSGYEPYRDIDIVYTGLRPGEKLYEELLHNNEVQKSEINEKIMIGKIQTFDPHQTLPLIDELIRCSRMIDRKGLVKKMKEIVPEFISNNSIYCELDKIVTGEKITSVTTTDHCCQKVL